MEILAGFVIGFALVQLGVAIFNLRGKASWLSADKDLPGQLSILIPARNEAHTLPLLLSDLLEQEYLPLEIMVCDDHSDDGTSAIVGELRTRHPHIRVFQGEDLPAGWLGKNFACYQLAQQARGRYLLFLDADVRIGKNGIAPFVTLARQWQTGLLSVFPRQLMQTRGEKATVPLMTYILLTLLPLQLVYKVKDQSALAAANGQFMLFEADAYRAIQPHSQVRDEAVEDVAISRLYKKSGQRVACLTGTADVSCRMYTSGRQAISGFARNIAGFFGNSLSVAFLFWLFTAWGWLAVLWAFSWPGLLAYLILRTSIRIIVARISCQSIPVNTVYSVFQQWNLGLILFHAWSGRKKGFLEWKGRNIIKPKKHG